MIEALKLALDALENHEGNYKLGDAGCDRHEAAITAIKEALAQRTEPPAWFPAVENILKEYGLQAMDFVADFKEAMKDAEQSQRTWVGLTEEEIGDEYVRFEVSKGGFNRFEYAVRAIEAKLKDKNS